MKAVQNTLRYSQVANRISAFKQTIKSNQILPSHVINLSDDQNSNQTPQFLRDYIMEATKTGSMQYTLPSGIPPLLESIAQFYEPLLGYKLNPLTQVTVTPGTTATFSCAFLAFLNPNDEVIVFEPAQEYYKPQIEFIGAKYVGVPMKRVKDWEIDWKILSTRLNERTKILIINTPHNPSGKIFSEDEIKEMTKILIKYPQVLVILDETQAGVCFDQYQPFKLPRIEDPELQQRTLTISSAGDLFSSQGLGLGYAIGNAELITGIRSINQYQFFCVNEPFQKAAAKALNESKQNDYFQQRCQEQLKHRDILLNHLNQSKLGIQAFIPQGGSFIVTDVSKVELQDKFYVRDGVKITQDKAFVNQLLETKQILTYPMTNGYSEEYKMYGESLVRWSFNKTIQEINDIGMRLSE